ncbi:MAG: transketolase [Deltaproteobacteria bacterium]|nr:transketolase [Deltaproteobacteria bacterium]
MDRLSADCRRIILEQSKRANVGHIGSALSVVDIITALYMRVLRIPSPGDPDRDRFILSKGHAALALYAAFYMKKWLNQEELNTYCCNESYLGVHPDHKLKGIDFSTGSLGMGLTMGAGAALAARMQTSKRRVFVLLSDAECNEGSVWEAAMFSAHHGLDNLIAIIDLNGQQALGYTRNVLAMNSMSERWRAFGWDARDVDGHDIQAMTDTIETLKETRGIPHVLIAHTTFGKGVSFMERQIKWHYMPMNDEEYEIALREIDHRA